MSSFFGASTGSGFGSNQQQQSSNPFGSSLSTTSMQNKTGGLFGALGTPTHASQPQQQSGGLFSNLGSTTQQQTQGDGGLSGSSSQGRPRSVYEAIAMLPPPSPPPPSLFSTLGSITQQQAQGGSGGLFGSSSQPQQSGGGGGGLFGSSSQPQQSGGGGGGLFGSSSQPQQSGGGGGGLFGSSSQPQQSGGGGGGLFGSSSQPQQSGGLFGNSGQSTQQQQGGRLFSGLGASTQQQQPQQQGAGLFGGLGQSTQQPQAGGLFGGLGQNTQQQQQQQQLQQQPQTGSFLGQSQAPSLGSIWQPGSGLSPRQKTIPEQIKLVAEKWDPNSSNTVFQTYLYNYVNEDQAPFYRPGPQDDEAKWEEALQKKPSAGAIPVLYKGFFQLGQRLLVQKQHLDVLQGRLHEINNSLTVMLQNHDLVISIRAADCRRKHVVLSQRCLALATKVQILRNRGYALDSAEEELRKRLMALERGVFDSALTGREEDIWARLLGVRKRAKQLQLEFDKSGSGLLNGSENQLDEEVAKKAKKILEDYDAQLSHLTKELTQIQKDLAEWEGNSNGGPNGNGKGK